MNALIEREDKPRIVNYELVNNTPLQVRTIVDPFIVTYDSAGTRHPFVVASKSSVRNYRRGHKFYAVRVYNEVTLHHERRLAEQFMRDNANTKPEMRTFRARNAGEVPEWAQMTRERVVTVSFNLKPETAYKMFGSEGHNAKHVRKQKEAKHHEPR